MPTKKAIKNTYDRMARDRTSAVHCLLSSSSPLHDEEAGSWFVTDHETAKRAPALPGLLPRDSENATADLTDAQRVRVRPLSVISVAGSPSRTESPSVTCACVCARR
ncbi:hypothetical protein ABMX48_08175 [Streptomyces cavourensis]